MSLRDRTMQLMAPLFKPLRDPGRAERVLREFGESRGFHAYDAFCRDRFAGDDSHGSDDLNSHGVLRLRVLGEAEARSFLQRILAGHTLATINKRSPHLRGFRITDRAFRSELLHAILRPTVDGHLTRFFRSHYLVYWMTVSATSPAEDTETVSFRWHCDKGPRNHLKLIVYLNGHPDHDGSTSFITRSETAAIAARGYVFGRVRSRTKDLTVLRDLADRPISPHTPVLRAGDGVAFQPATVLHRGTAPERGTRYALTLCLLPSPVPWTTALERGVGTDLSVHEKWPRHANELLASLDPPAPK